MRALIEKAQPLAAVLWAGETEGKDFSTPERRAGLEAALDERVKAIRDPKIAAHYRRDFADRVFQAFSRARPGGPASRSRTYPGRLKGRRDGERPFVQETVSAAVKQSAIAISGHAGRAFCDRRYLALLLEMPESIDTEAEALAEIAFSDGELDILRRELLNLAASGTRLDKAAVEAHLVRQGIGALAERLTTHSVLQLDLKERADNETRETLLLRTRQQLADPDGSGSGELKARRDRALQLYLDSGAEEDWNELQRLNGELRQARGL
jgi:DNA primase